MNPTDHRRPIPLVETPARWPFVALTALWLLAFGAAAAMIFSP